MAHTTQCKTEKKTPHDPIKYEEDKENPPQTLLSIHDTEKKIRTLETMECLILSYSLYLIFTNRPLASVWSICFMYTLTHFHWWRPRSECEDFWAFLSNGSLSLTKSVVGLSGIVSNRKAVSKRFIRKYTKHQ